MHHNQTDLEPSHTPTHTPREVVIELGDMFQGPLSVLLALASKEELPAHEIKLQDLIHQYLLFKNEEKNRQLEHGSEFISACSTLHYLKSSSLVAENIPTKNCDKHSTDTSSDEVNSSEDLLLAEKLIYALYEYADLKNHAYSLSLLEKEERKSFTRPISIQDNFPRRLPSQIPCSVEDLALLFQLLIQKRKNNPVHYIGQETWTIEEALYIVKSRVADKKEEGLAFTELFKSNDQDLSIESYISIFLALLELIKQGTIHIFILNTAQQKENHEEYGQIGYSDPILLHNSFVLKKRAVQDVSNASDVPTTMNTLQKTKKSKQNEYLT